MSASFSVEDVRLLEKTISLRERLIDTIVAQSPTLPTKPREVESFTSLLESVDKSIFAKAKIRLDDTNTRVNEETKEILKDLLLDLHKSNNTKASAPTELKGEAPVFQPTGQPIKEGELIPKVDPSDGSEYIQT